MLPWLPSGKTSRVTVRVESRSIRRHGATLPWGVQELTLPDTIVQVQHRFGLFDEVRILGAYPGLVILGLNGIGGQHSPSRTLTDGLTQSCIGAYFHVSRRLPTQQNSVSATSPRATTSTRAWSSGGKQGYPVRAHRGGSNPSWPIVTSGEGPSRDAHPPTWYPPATICDGSGCSCH